MKPSTNHFDLSTSVIAVSLIGGGAMGLGLGLEYRFDWLFAGLGTFLGLLIGLLISLATVRGCDWLRLRIVSLAGAPATGGPRGPLLLAATLAVELMKLAAPVSTMSLLVAWIDFLKEGRTPF